MWPVLCKLIQELQMLAELSPSSKSLSHALSLLHLQVQEAMLTGESVPVSKHLHAAPPAASLGDRRCMCYSATAVVSGQAQGVVVATGDSAEIGQINKMVNTVGDSPLQRWWPSLRVLC
eukprot:GHRR01019504.1.p2 GENE.GHRR01019504.1~~GHRR01019504.1.p2  ORF type:complete len:119 (+),score=24.45 GHRR01019504.1:1128-1484(+)